MNLLSQKNWASIFYSYVMAALEVSFNTKN